MWIPGSVHFWCKGVQPMCTVMLRLQDGCLLQTMWKREVSSVQTTCSWGWARLLHPSSIHVRRNGLSCATVTYKRLASLLATKRELLYSVVMGRLRCRLSFSLLRSAVMYLRGSRFACNHVPCNSMHIAVHKGRIPFVGRSTNHATLF